MASIFLSYSRKDIEIMYKVRDQLRAARLEVWTDENLEPGTPSWTQAIEEALENAACLVVIFTPSSKDSKWVKEEINYANAHEVRIFPILASGDEKRSIPFGFTTVQRVDIRSDFEHGISYLLTTLRKYLTVDSREAETPATEEHGEWPDRYHQRRDFWTQLLQKSRGRTNLLANVSPSHNYWLGTGAGKTGFSLNYTLYEDWAGVELYIDLEDYAKNKTFFETLHEQKDTIESEFGGSLEWERLDNKRASRIRKRIEGLGGRTSPEKWPELQEAMIDTMIRLDKALRPKIKELRV